VTTLPAEVRAEGSSVFHRFLDHAYPNVERGEGVHLYLTDGREILDASSGGAMVTCLGHANRSVIDAAATQAGRIAYVYNHHFTNDAQERLAERLLATTAPEMARVRFVSGGSEANETALRLVRQYHVDRGEPERWRVVSPAQAYHGATLAALSLTGRPKSLQSPFGDYLPAHLHIPPSTPRLDPTGEQALAALDRVLAEAGPETVAAFLCEPVSAAALPAYSPPDRFWRGLEERRREHGFLIVFDEIVTGMGRTGSWFAYQQLPIEPDVITCGKGLGAGYAPLAACLCRDHVYDALANGSRELEHGHTWDGAPLPCAVGVAVLDVFENERLVERVHERGPSLRDELEASLSGLEIVGDVRGRGYLLGVELFDPRDGESFLPDELHVAELVDDVAYEHGVLVTSSNSTPDGYCGDQTVLAPPYTSTDEELAGMVDRFRGALGDVEQRIKEKLG
jgi:adenosylmethionine-8-amino-7-oxononanoate aminotransferase